MNNFLNHLLSLSLVRRICTMNIYIFFRGWWGRGGVTGNKESKDQGFIAYKLWKLVLWVFIILLVSSLYSHKSQASSCLSSHTSYTPTMFISILHWQNFPLFLSSVTGRILGSSRTLTKAIGKKLSSGSSKIKSDKNRWGKY